jgi:mRNA interferase HigB
MMAEEGPLWVHFFIPLCRLCQRGPTISLAPRLGAEYNPPVRVIALKTLRAFWEHHLNARQSLQAWYQDVIRATWKSPADIKSVYRNASILANNRVVFNIKGNRYRLVVAVQYQFGIVYIRFVGTHSEYDKIEATLI